MVVIGIIYLCIALIVIFGILLIIGIILLIRAFILKKKKTVGISLSLIGGTPILLICLFIHFTFFYVSDDTCKQIFTTDTQTEFPASAKVIHKDFSLQIWTDYDDAMALKMNQADYTELMNTIQSDSIFLYDDEPFICSSGRAIMEKANIKKKDMTWFNRGGTHHKAIGFHSNKQTVIYFRFRY